MIGGVRKAWGGGGNSSESDSSDDDDIDALSPSSMARKREKRSNMRHAGQGDPPSAQATQFTIDLLDGIATLRDIRCQLLLIGYASIVIGVIEWIGCDLRSIEGSRSDKTRG